MQTFQLILYIVFLDKLKIVREVKMSPRLRKLFEPTLAPPQQSVLGVRSPTRSHDRIDSQTSYTQNSVFIKFSKFNFSLENLYRNTEKKVKFNF